MDYLKEGIVLWMNTKEKHFFSEIESLNKKCIFDFFNLKIA